MMALALDKREVRSYIDESLYDQLKEASELLDLSMSKIIGKCLLQGLEVMMAEAEGREPKVTIKELKAYLKNKK